MRFVLWITSMSVAKFSAVVVIFEFGPTVQFGEQSFLNP